MEAAADADGLDLKNFVVADISELDTSTPGEYPVTLSVRDFAGNETSVVFSVTVTAE